jgi:hypothetical protein
VSPSAADAGMISDWLDAVRQANAVRASAALALDKIHVGKFFKQIGRAGHLDSGALNIISGFGFQVCGETA